MVAAASSRRAGRPRVFIKTGRDEVDVTDAPPGAALSTREGRQVVVRVDGDATRVRCEHDGRERRRSGRGSTFSVSVGNNKQNYRQSLRLTDPDGVLLDINLAMVTGSSSARGTAIAAHVSELARYEAHASPLLGALDEALAHVRAAIAAAGGDALRRGGPDSPLRRGLGSVLVRLLAASSRVAGGFNDSGRARELALRDAVTAPEGTLTLPPRGALDEVEAHAAQLRGLLLRSGIRPTLRPAPLASAALRGAVGTHLRAAQQAATRVETSRPPLALAPAEIENVDSYYELWTALALAERLALLAGRSLSDVLLLPPTADGRVELPENHELARVDLCGAPVRVIVFPRFQPETKVDRVPAEGVVVTAADRVGRARVARGMTPDLVLVHGDGPRRRLHVFDAKNYTGKDQRKKLSDSLLLLWRNYGNYVGMLTRERRRADRPPLPCVQSVISLHPADSPVWLAPAVLDPEWPQDRPRVFGLPMRPGEDGDLTRLDAVLGALLEAELR